jgi:hypothetical protein
MVAVGAGLDFFSAGFSVSLQAKSPEDTPKIANAEKIFI